MKYRLILVATFILMAVLLGGCTMSQRLNIEAGYTFLQCGGMGGEHNFSQCSWRKTSVFAPSTWRSTAPKPLPVYTVCVDGQPVPNVWTGEPSTGCSPVDVAPHRGLDVFSETTIILKSGRWLAQQESSGEWSLVDPRTGQPVAYGTLDEMKARAELW
jgi:hypothetical protein